MIREVAPAQFQLDDLTLQVALIRDHRSQTTLPSADAVPRSPGFRWSDTGPMWWEPTWQATPTPALASEPRLIPIVTTAPVRDPQELVALYTRRWPVQENSIKDWLLPLGLDCNHGYAKTEVLIPNRMLKTNIEMRETHYGTQPFFVISQLVETLAENFNQRIK